MLSAYIQERFGRILAVQPDTNPLGGDHAWRRAGGASVIGARWARQAGGEDGEEGETVRRARNRSGLQKF